MPRLRKRVGNGNDMFGFGKREALNHKNDCQINLAGAIRWLYKEDTRQHADNKIAEV